MFRPRGERNRLEEKRKIRGGKENKKKEGGGGAIR